MIIKGYTIGSGYMGYIPWENDYQLFETDDEHKEYIQDNEEEFK